MSPHDSSEEQRAGEPGDRSRKSLRLLLRIMLATLRLVWSATPGGLIASVLLALPQALAVPVLLIITREFVNAVAAHGSRGAGIGTYLPTAVLLGLVTVARMAFGDVSQRQDQAFAERVTAVAEQRFLHTVAYADWGHFDDPGWHDRMQRASEEVSFRLHQLTGNLMNIVSQTVSLVGVTAVLWSIDPILVAIAAVAAFAAAPMHRTITRRWYRFNQSCAEYERQSWYLRWLVSDRFPGKEVRAFGLEEELLRRRREMVDEHLAAKMRMYRTDMTVNGLAGVLGGLILGGAYILLAVLAGRGTLSPGDLTAALGALTSVSVGLAALSQFMLRIEQHSTFLDDYFSFLRTQPLLPVTERPSPLPAGPVGIELDRVSFAYRGAEQPALRDLSLHIRQGELIALVGDNGAGKTTLVKLLLRLYDPDSGSVRIGGVDLRDADLNAVRARIGVLFQDFNVYMLSARDNIQFGRVDREATDAEIWETLTRARADGVVRQRPDGLDAQLGMMFSGGTELSGGESQRLALARLMFRDADIWILDEPTSALDADSEAHIFTQLREDLDGRTGIIISHRMSTVKIADRIAVMQEGRITELGTHGELMSAGGRYAELYELQAKGFMGNDDAPDIKFSGIQYRRL
ncbi:MAG TPA: ABC transporter ATP-binding protein [Streptosporangiaceae bacterium]|nr:ABC transporter ATP-binding protein [Streptosporangiaceae bacterium]